MSSCLLFWKHRRYTVCFFCFLGFYMSYLMRISLNVAILAMTGHTQLQVKEFNWTEAEETILIGSFFYGYILTQIPGGYLAYRIGGQKIFLASVFMGSIFSFVTPICAKWSFLAIRIIRILLGVVQGVIYPAAYDILYKWATPKERSEFCIIAITGSNVGSFLGINLVGQISSKYGWKWVFYICGIFGFIWCIFWIILMHYLSIKNSRTNRNELTHLENNLSVSHIERRKKIPWKQIFTSLPVWATVVSHFGQSFGFYLILMQLPILMKGIYGLQVKSVSILVSFPHLLLIISCTIGGCLSEKFIRKEYLSVTNVRKLFSCGACFLQGLAAIGAACWISPAGTIVCSSLMIGAGGLNWAGSGVNHLDICPQYACITMGLSNTFGCLSGLLTTGFTHFIVQSTLVDEVTGWRIIFFITSWFDILGIFFYAAYASGERQIWAATEESLAIPQKSHKDFAFTKSFCC